MSSIKDKIHNITHYGEPGYHHLDNNLEIAPQGFFGRIYSWLFKRSEDERIVNLAFHLIKDNKHEVGLTNAELILKHIRPLIHDPLLHIQANVLLSNMEIEHFNNACMQKRSVEETKAAYETVKKIRPGSQTFEEYMNSDPKLKTLLVDGTKENQPNVLDLLVTRPNVRLLAAAEHIRVPTSQLKRVVDGLSDFKKTANSELPLVSITIVFRENESEIDAKTVENLQSLQALFKNPPRIQYANKEPNQTLTIEGSSIPVVSGVTELTLKGDVDVRAALKHYPKLAFLDATGVNAPLSAHELQALFPEIGFIREVNKPFSIQYGSVSRTHVDQDDANRFWNALKAGQLSKHLEPELTLNFGETTYKAHKAILANCSHVFRTSTVTEIKSPGFDKVLEFAYTGHVTIENVKQALEIVDSTEELQIPDLLNFALEYLANNLNEQTFIPFNSLGNHTKRVLIIFAESHLNLASVQEILNDSFPIAQPIPAIQPLKLDSPTGFSDYSISVGERTWNLHKAILASRNSFYYAYFQDDGLSSEGIHAERDGVNSEAQKAVYTYIYEGNLPVFQTNEEAQNILWVADHDQIPEIKEAAFVHLRETMLLIAQQDNRSMLRNLESYIELCIRYSQQEFYIEAIQRAMHLAYDAVAENASNVLLGRYRVLVDQANRECNLEGSQECLEAIDFKISQNMEI